MRKTESSECTGRGTLMDRITRSDNLNNAYKRVKCNKGAPGIDGMTVEQLALYLKEQGETVRRCLQQGKWQPSSVRKVMIPKPDGGERQLGIPPVLIGLHNKPYSRYYRKIGIPIFLRIAMVFAQSVQLIMHYFKRNSTFERDMIGLLILTC
nr:hypothetical protein [Photobacterium carnosum]